MFTSGRKTWGVHTQHLPFIHITLATIPNISTTLHLVKNFSRSSTTDKINKTNGQHISEYNTFNTVQLQNAIEFLATGIASHSYTVRQERFVM
jgi:hypothetical protein